MWALLPLKSFANAKQRLSDVLTPEERAGLFQAMVQDVLKVLQLHPDIENTLIVSDDTAARELAQSYGADFLFEPTFNNSWAAGEKRLNAAIQAGVNELAARGTDEVMIIHGDLPLISTSEISQLIRSHRQQGAFALTIAPDTHGVGSNCLLCTPAAGFTYCFGKNSFANHVSQANQLGMSLQTITLPGVGCDIDTPADLLTLINRAEQHSTSHTLRYLSTHGLLEPLKRREAAMVSETELAYSWAS